MKVSFEDGERACLAGTWAGGRDKGTHARASTAEAHRPGRTVDRLLLCLRLLLVGRSQLDVSLER